MQQEAHKDIVLHRWREHGWTFWLIPKRAGLAISALYLSIPLLFFYYSPLLLAAELPGVRATLWLREILIIGAVLILLAIDRVEYWLYGEATPARRAVLLLVLRIILIESIAQLDTFRSSPFLYLVVPFMAVLYFGNLSGYCLAGLAWGVYILKHMLNSPGWYSDRVELQYFVTFSVGLVFVITLAQVVVREQRSRARTEQLLSELEVSHRQLKAYAEQVEELAATKERNRLARDMHDSLGHYLTVINVQLEKALAFRSKKPQEADQAIHAAKDLASEALQDVRRSVSALRAVTESFSAYRALGILIERLESSQLAIKLQVEGSEADFSQEALLALYRAAQEGLTNVQKHARATKVRIELHFGADEATLHLRDNGQGFDPAVLRQLTPGREGGYGLQGVQERLEQLGGSFQLETAPGRGTHLTVSVPKALAAQHELPESLARKGGAG